MRRPLPIFPIARQAKKWSRLAAAGPSDHHADLQNRADEDQGVQIEGFDTQPRRKFNAAPPHAVEPRWA